MTSSAEDFAFDEAPKVRLDVAPDELAGIIEALHDGVLRRLRWSTYADQSFDSWRSLDLGLVQTVIDNMVKAYTKAVMVYRDNTFSNENSFENKFLWPDEIFELIGEILAAKSWDDIPIHPIHAPEVCKVCCTIFSG